MTSAHRGRLPRSRTSGSKTAYPELGRNLLGQKVRPGQHEDREERDERTTEEGGPQLTSNVGASFVPLNAPAVIKITAANDNAAVSCRIRSKTVTLRAG